MERTLLNASLLLGVVGLLSGALLAARNFKGWKSLLSTRVILLAAGLPVMVFLATLPTKAPFFAEGHGFGWGFLCGGLAAFVVTLLQLLAVSGTVPARSAFRDALTNVLPHLTGLLVVALVLLRLRGSLDDTLLGVAIGWFCSVFILLTGAKRDMSEKAVLPAVNGLGFVVLLCALACLGEARNPMTLAGGKTLSWSVFALGCATLVAFLLPLTTLLLPILARIGANLPLAGLFARVSTPVFHSEDTGIAVGRAVRLILGCLLVLFFANRFVHQIGEELPVVKLLAMGMGVALLLWWLVGTSQSVQTPTSHAPRLAPYANGPYKTLSLLVLLIAVMMAWQLLAGMGIGLLLLGAWFIAGLGTVQTLEAEDAPDSAGSPMSDVLRLLFCGLILLLFRVFMTLYGSEVRGMGLSDLYALVGLILGTMLPALLAGMVSRPADTQPERGIRIGTLLVTGLLTLLVPTFLLVLYGEKIALPLLIGLALSAVLLEPNTRRDEGENPLVVLLPALFGVAVALALTQWTQHVLPWGLLSRPEKVRLLGYGVGSVIAILLLTDYSGRFLDGRKRGQGALKPEGGTQ